ncbi:MAG: glycosyltransferase family 2 protein [Pseudomonadota bacterium]
MTARITVIIPAFRSAETVGAAVASALGQTVDCQVIIVDDASPDGTVAAAHAAAQGSPRVSILEQAENQGPAAARNRAIAAAETEFIALLDADDRMAPDRLEALMQYADSRNWDFVADDQWRVSDWGRVDAATRLWRDQPFGDLELTLEEFVLENLTRRCGRGRELGFIKPLMRREALLRHNLLYDETMRLGEDFDLYARALAAGLSFGLVDPLGYYAFNSKGSLSREHRAEDLKGLWRASKVLHRRSGLPRAAREALKAHALYTHGKWAWARLIEAKQNRDVVNAVGAFIAPPSVIGGLFRNIGHHVRGRSGAKPAACEELA